MEKDNTPEFEPSRREPVDARAMLEALDLMANGPARRAMEAIDGSPSDMPAGNPRHDFEDK